MADRKLAALKAWETRKARKAGLQPPSRKKPKKNLGALLNGWLEPAPEEIPHGICQSCGTDHQPPACTPAEEPDEQAA